MVRLTINHLLPKTEGSPPPRRMGVFRLRKGGELSITSDFQY